MESFDSLVEKLRDTNWRVRADAVQRLGKLRDPRALPYLIHALGDEFEYVSSLAAEALGNIGDRQAVPALIRLVEENPRRSAAETAARVLARFREPRASEAVVKALLALPTPSWGSTYIQSLVEIGDTNAIKSLVKTIVERCKRESDSNLVDWVETLGKLGDPDAVPYLSQLLDHPKSAVVTRAIDAIGAIGAKHEIQEEIKKKITGLLRYWKSASVRESAAKALGKIQYPPAISELFSALRDRDENVRRAATQAILSYRHPEVVPELLRMLEESGWYPRKVAALALGNIGDLTSVPYLLEKLRLDERYDVRKAAAQALANHDLWKLDSETLQDAVDTLIQAYNRLSPYHDEDFRSAIIKALGRTRSERVLDMLLDALTDKGMVDAVAEALSELRRTEAVEPLVRLASLRTSVRDRAAIVKALGKLGDPRAIPTIENGLKSRSSELRTASAESLRMLLFGHADALLSLPARARHFLERKVREVERERIRAELCSETGGES